MGFKIVYLNYYGFLLKNKHSYIKSDSHILYGKT